MSKKVCILTSVHHVFDVRIFHKQAKALSNAGYDVTIVAGNERNEIVDGIKIQTVERKHNRLLRMLYSSRNVCRSALEQNADIYHLHDPELLLWSAQLKWKGKSKVIYDIHEYVAHQILRKSWIPKPLRYPTSSFYSAVEKNSLKHIDWIILAEDSYLRLYSGFANVSVVRNYPILSKFKLEKEGNSKDNFPMIVYAGRISKDRGIFLIINIALKLKEKDPGIQFNIIGPIDKDIESGVKERIAKWKLDRNVVLFGQLPYHEALQKIGEAHIGLCILYPIANYVESLPTKLFEYMNEGLPVVVSNFPLWKSVVEECKCGITISPFDEKSIVKAIMYLLDNEKDRRKMGENGKTAVLHKYNWNTQESILLKVYKQLSDRAEK